MTDQDFVALYFKTDHLPERLRQVSLPFGTLARAMLELPCNRERTKALDRLLEAKDAAVRSSLTGVA